MRRFREFYEYDDYGQTMIPIGTNLQRRKLPRATLGLILANAVVFAVELALPDHALRWTVQHLGFGPGTRNPIAPVTHFFMHGSIYHIAFNMLFLWVFGGPVEERIGTKNFLKYYFGAGLAAGFLQTVMEMIARPGSAVPCIGASGAVSGIMAIFLYRCFYSKLRMVLTPLFLPTQVNIPAIPLVLLWFFQDVFMGYISLSVPTGIGHWAHIGGFTFGIAMGRLNRYGHEGRVEQIRSRVAKKLADGGGWKAAEEDLLRLLKRAPDDAEVNHDLARLYSDKGETGPSERHYTAAVQQYFRTQPLAAAYAVIEHGTVLNKPMDTHYLVKAADALVKEFQYEDAHKVLTPLAASPGSSNALAEKGLFLFIKISLQLHLVEDAESAARLFVDRFPNSRHQTDLKTLMNLKKTGGIFPPVPASPESGTRPAERSKEAKEADRLGLIDIFERVFADPAFWLILLALNMFGPLLFPGVYFARLSPLYLFIAAFVMTIVHRMGSIGDLISAVSGLSEKKVLREAERSRRFDDAVMADKCGRYGVAASLYEKLLAEEAGNIQARFNLARIYQRRLNDAAKARLHYRVLAEHTPTDHPFHSEAVDALKELTGQEKPGAVET